MKEYVIGNLVGISQVLIGYPLDTLKTNIQNAKDIKIFSKNPITLYRGISYPLIINSIGTSFLFGNYEMFYTQTNNRLISGILTGIISAIILTPFDYKKILLQTNSHIYIQNTLNNTINNNAINNNVDKYYTSTKINIKNIKKYYAGFTYTCARESIAIPIYFYTYHYLNNITNPFIAGGIAGINSWLFTYPIDTIKTRAQLYQNKSLYEIIKMGSLYNGLIITLVRAFIVNGTSFYLYETIKNNT